MARDESAAPANKAKEVQVFTTGAGLDVNELYTPADVAGLDYDKDLGYPGEYPFTRGPYPGMYRERIWTRRFQVGFGTPQETNERIKYLAKTGANGFVITIDLPTSYGFDSDDPIAEGEVGSPACPSARWRTWRPSTPASRRTPCPTRSPSGRRCPR